MCYSHIIPKTSDSPRRAISKVLVWKLLFADAKNLFTKKTPHKNRRYDVESHRAASWVPYYFKLNVKAWTREILAFSQSQVINSLGNKFSLNHSVKTTKNIPMFLERGTLIWPVVAGFGRARAGRTRPLKIRLVPGPSIPVVPVEGNALLQQPYKNIQEQHATYNVIPGQWDNSANPCLCDQ